MEEAALSPVRDRIRLGRIIRDGGSRRSRVFALAVGLFLLLGAGDVLAWGGEWGRHLWIDTGWTLAGVLSTLACLRTGLRVRSPYRATWVLIALGCASWLVGQLAWDYYELFASFPPSPSLADIGYLGFAPLCIAGLVLLTTRTCSCRFLLVLDVVVLALAAGVVFTTIFYEDIARSGLGNLGVITALFYPI